MTEALFLILLAICGRDFFAALLKPPKFCELPTLMSLSYVGFVFPQAFALLAEPAVMDGELAKVLFLAILLLLSTKLGWHLAVSNRDECRYEAFDEEHLLWAVAGASLLGATFSIWLANLPIELTGVSQWTGAPTILYFFKRFQVLALALSLVCFMRSGRRSMLYWALFNAAFLVPSALLDARREPTIELVLLLVLTMWFGRRRLPSRLWVVGGGIVIFVFVNSIAQVRRLLFQTNDEGLRVRASATLEEFFTVNPFVSDVAPIYSEVGNAARIVQSIDASGQHSWGARIWDTLVFNYVPGQWVGFENKQALQFYQEGIPETANVRTDLGTTITAFADTFEAFGYIGPCLLYVPVGLLYGSLFRVAMAGSLFHQYFYAASITAALLTVTHGFMVLPARLPAMLLFSMLIFFFLKRSLVWRSSTLPSRD